MVVAPIGIGMGVTVATYYALKFVASEKYGAGGYLDFKSKDDHRLAILISVVIGVVAALLALAFL